MSNIINAKVRHKRGTEASMPTLADGQLYLPTDKRKLYKGTASGNICISDMEKLEQLENSIDTKQNSVLIPNGTSTANVIVLDITLVNAKKYSFKALANSTGNVTINGKTFKKYDNSLVGNGDITASKVYDFYYDSTSDCVFILAKAEGNAIASDVLAGKTFSNGISSNVVGTMDLSLLTTANIKGGITINGVTGSPSVVNTNDATAVAGDIVSGKSGYVNGSKILGTATVASLGGKRFASGSVASSALQTFTKIDGATIILSPIIVSGLSFKPSIILITYSSGGTTFTARYDENVDGVYTKKVVLDSYSVSTHNAPVVIKGDISPCNITNGGFTIPALGGSGLTCSWSAYE